MRTALLLPFMAGFLCVSLIVASGCARTPNAKFYTLNSLEDTAAEATESPAEGGGVIGLGPVELPGYLDRPQIVTRVSPNEVRLSEFHRWAAPLDGSVLRILAENLSVLLGTDRIARYPWDGNTPIACRVEIEVSRFDGSPGNRVVLQGQWTLYSPDRKKVLASGTSTLDEPVDGHSYDALVSAQSRVLAALSRELAHAVASLPRGVPGE